MAEEQTDLESGGGIGRSQPLRIAGLVLLLPLWVANLAIHHSDVEKVLGFVLIPVLVQVSITDLEERRIWDRVTLPAAVVALVIGLLMHPSGVPEQLVAGALTGAFLFVFAVLSRGGLGMGDVKLGVVLGLFLGKDVLTALIVGLLASSVLSVIVLVRHGIKRGRKMPIPLGPFLAFGGVVAVLAGPLLQHST